MRITEPQGPFPCPPCAQRLRSSLRRWDRGEHALPPECSDHHRPLRLTNGGELASCKDPTGKDPTGYDVQGGRTWRLVRRARVRYDEAGRPMPAVELRVRTIGRSVRRL